MTRCVPLCTLTLLYLGHGGCRTASTLERTFSGGLRVCTAGSREAREGALAVCKLLGKLPLLRTGTEGLLGWQPCLQAMRQPGRCLVFKGTPSFQTEADGAPQELSIPCTAGRTRDARRLGNLSLAHHAGRAPLYSTPPGPVPVHVHILRRHPPRRPPRDLGARPRGPHFSASSGADGWGCLRTRTAQPSPALPCPQPTAHAAPA